MITDKKIPERITITGIHSPLTDAEPSDVELDIAKTGEPDETKEEYYGFFSKRGSSIYLTYEVSDSDALLTQMIKITLDPLVIKKTATFRKGTITQPASCLIYEEGKACAGFYTTPYGRLDTETDTRKVLITEGDQDVSCYIEGSMKINNSPVSEFTLKIEAVTV